MTPPVVAMARVDAVLREQYRVMPSTRRAILRHVFGNLGLVLVTHLVSRMVEYGWTAEQAAALGRAVRAGGER